jgi:hypothetical protein
MGQKRLGGAPPFLQKLPDNRYRCGVAFPVRFLSYGFHLFQELPECRAGHLSLHNVYLRSISNLEEFCNNDFTGSTSTTSATKATKTTTIMILRRGGGRLNLDIFKLRHYIPG